MTPAEILKNIDSDVFRSIIALSVDGFTLLDTSGHIIEVNESYCRMVGYGTWK